MFLPFLKRFAAVLSLLRSTSIHPPFPATMSDSEASKPSHPSLPLGTEALGEGEPSEAPAAPERRRGCRLPPIVVSPFPSLGNRLGFYSSIHFLSPGDCRDPGWDPFIHSFRRGCRNSSCTRHNRSVPLFPSHSTLPSPLELHCFDHHLFCCFFFLFPSE